MRNLKRALSLTLASVMLLGMMVVGSNAAAGYDDVKDTDNVEAIEVLQTIEVMVGDERGFGPDRPVNRAEMAVVMGKLLNLNYDYYSASCPFNDVYDWARGYVGACYANKILSGRSETVYDPGSTVTAVEAALMLMRALGYFQYANDTADGWQLATVRQGNKIGIFDQVGSSATDPMTRNQVAQMVLNALKSGTVEPDGNTINLTTPDGSVFTGKVNYVFVTSDKPFAKAISNVEATAVGSQNGGAIVELGERLYTGDLRLENYDLDDFGRPSRTWSYKGNDIGTYAKREQLRVSYEEGVKGGKIYEDIGDTACKYGLTYTVDGNEYGAADTKTEKEKLVRRNDDTMTSTGRGVQTEVYVDNDRGYEQTYIAVINTWLAKAATDYRDKTEDIRIEVYDHYNDGTPPETGSRTYTVDVEDIPAIKDLKEDDMFLVRMSANEIHNIYDVETVDGVTITEYNADRINANQYDTYTLKSLTAGGTKYNANVKTFWEAQYIYDHETEDLHKATYNLYLDLFGNVIGVEQVDAEDNYVFIVGYDRNSTHLAKAIDSALAIFPDGSMKTIQVRDDEVLKVAGMDTKLGVDGIHDGREDVNLWFTYTMDGTIYELDKLVERQIISSPANSNLSQDMLDKQYSTIKDGTTATKIAVGNKDSVFITVDAGDEVNNTAGSIVDVNGTVTGIQDSSIKIDYYAGLSRFNANDDNMIFAVYDSKGYIKYAVVVGNGSNSDDYVYLTTGTENHGILSDGTYYWTYTGITKDGFETFRSFTSKDNLSAQLAKHNLYEMARNSDGIVTKNGAKYKANLEDLTPAVDLNTDGYRKAGYARTDIDTVQELYANGQTFQYDIKNNNQFIHMTSDCKFFVWASDDDEYVEYGSVSSALNALGNNHDFTGTVTALTNSNGFAEVLILYDTYTGNDDRNSFNVTYTGDTNMVNVVELSAKPVTKGNSFSFTVTAKPGYELVSVKVGGNALTPDGSTYTINKVTQDTVVAIEAKSQMGDLPEDAVVTMKSDGTAFKLFWDTAATKPEGTDAAMLLIDAAQKAGYTNVKAVPGTDPNDWVITGEKGPIQLNTKYDDSADAVESFVGMIDGNEVYVKKGSSDTALSALHTFGNSTLTAALPGTYVKAGATDTGLTGGTPVTVAAGATAGKYYDYAATFNASGFDLTTGFVSVTGDGVTGTGIIPMGADYKLPLKSTLTSPKGTGMMYTVGGAGKTYIKYDTSIDAAKITGNIVLAQDYVKVTVTIDGDKPTETFTVTPKTNGAALTAAGETFAKVEADGVVVTPGSAGTDLFVKTTGMTTDNDGSADLAAEAKYEPTGAADVTITIKKTAHS